MPPKKNLGIGRSSAEQKKEEKRIPLGKGLHSTLRKYGHRTSPKPEFKPFDEKYRRGKGNSLGSPMIGRGKKESKPG